MPIDLRTPTIRPPSALDLARPDFEDEATLPAPQSPTPYRTPAGARQGQRVANDLGGFASQTLASPSRFDLPLVQQGTALIDSELEDKGQRASMRLDEHHAQRGLVGSGVEAWNKKDMLVDLERERARRLFDLNMAMANTQAGDRATAASIGTQVGDFQRALGLDVENAGRYESEFARLLGRDTESDLQARAGLGLQGANLAVNADLARAGFGQGQYEFERMMGLQGGDLGLRQRALDLQAQGMSQDDAFRYAQLQQEQQQFGTGMDFQASQASLDRLLESEALNLQRQGMSQDDAFRYAQLRQEQQQFGTGMEFQRQQLAAELGIDQAQLDVQREQMAREYGDRQAERLHEMGLQEGSQEFQASQASLDRLLESEALDLQRQGLDAETAWRDADRALQERLEGRALDLRQQGLDDDKALRQAAMDLDNAMQQRQLLNDVIMEGGRQQVTQRGQNIDLMGLYGQLGLDAARLNQQAQLSSADIFLRALAAGAGDYLPDVDDPNTPWDDTRLMPPGMGPDGSFQWGVDANIPDLPELFNPIAYQDPTSLHNRFLGFPPQFRTGFDGYGFGAGRRPIFQNNPTPNTYITDGQGGDGDGGSWNGGYDWTFQDPNPRGPSGGGGSGGGGSGGGGPNTDPYTNQTTLTNTYGSYNPWMLPPLPRYGRLF